MLPGEPNASVAVDFRIWTGRCYIIRGWQVGLQRNGLRLTVPRTERNCEGSGTESASRKFKNAARTYRRQGFVHVGARCRLLTRSALDSYRPRPAYWMRRHNSRHRSLPDSHGELDVPLQARRNEDASRVLDALLHVHRSSLEHCERPKVLKIGGGGCSSCRLPARARTDGDALWRAETDGGSPGGRGGARVVRATNVHHDSRRGVRRKSCPAAVREQGENNKAGGPVARDKRAMPTAGACFLLCALVAPQLDQKSQPRLSFHHISLRAGHEVGKTRLATTYIAFIETLEP
jgi:hypothetical protein